MKLSLISNSAPTQVAPSSGDLLRGAAAIAMFLLDDASRPNRRVIYHLFEKKGLPAFKLGGLIYARKSTLSAWIDELEAKHDSLLYSQPP